MTTASPFTATAHGARVQAYAELAAQGSVVRVAVPTGLPGWLITC